MFGGEVVRGIIETLLITVVRALPFLAVITLEIRNPSVIDVFSEEFEEHFENEELYITGNWEKILSDNIKSEKKVKDLSKKIQQEAGIDFDQIAKDSEDITGYATDASRATRRVWVTSISVLAVVITALVNYVPEDRLVLILGVVVTLTVFAATWLLITGWVKSPISSNYPGDYLNMGKKIPILSQNNKILPVSRRIIYLNIIIISLLFGLTLIGIFIRHYYIDV